MDLAEQRRMDSKQEHHSNDHRKETAEERVMPWNSPKLRWQEWESELRITRAFGCNVGDVLTGGQSM